MDEMRGKAKGKWGRLYTWKERISFPSVIKVWGIEEMSREWIREEREKKERSNEEVKDKMRKDSRTRWGWGWGGSRKEMKWLTEKKTEQAKDEWRRSWRKKREGNDRERRKPEKKTDRRRRDWWRSQENQQTNKGEVVQMHPPPPSLVPCFSFFSVSNTWSLFYGWNMVFFILFLSEINDILQTHTDTGVRYVFYSLDFSRIWPHFPPGALKEFTDIYTLILKMYLRFQIAVCVVLRCTVTHVKRGLEAKWAGRMLPLL